MTPDELVARTDGFFPTVTLRNVPHGVCAQAKFDSAAYTPALYDAFGIDFPPQLRTAARKRQSDFLAGRLIAAMAIGQVVPIPIGADKGPVWPTGMCGSIAHSHDQCAAIIGNDGLLCGIDVERIATGSALEAILRYCLSAQEKSWVDRQDALAVDAIATLIFSAKECIFKALFPVVGKFFGFDCAEILRADTNGTVTLRLTQRLHPSLPIGFELTVACEITEGFVLTFLQMPRCDLASFGGN